MTKYDLAGNPLPEPVPRKSEPDGSADNSSEDSDPALLSRTLTPQSSSSWPPPAGIGSAGEILLPRNTSGEQGEVPLEIERLKWNWGAFGLNLFWCYYHGMLPAGLVIFVGNIFLVSFIGPISLPIYYGVLIYFGIMGNKFAWRNRRFEGRVPEFFAVQRAWTWWGIAAVVVWVVFTFVI